MNSVRASNVSRRPRRVSRPRPVQPERNHQERGDVSRASLSIAGRLVKQRAVGLNCVNYGMLCVYLVFMCGVYISAALVVVLKRCGVTAQQRSQSVAVQSGNTEAFVFVTSIQAALCFA